MNKLIKLKHSKTTWNILFFLLFLVFLDSFYIYFFWKIPHYIPLIVSIVSVFFIIIKPNYFNYNIRNFLPFLFFLLADLYSIREQNYFGVISVLLSFMCVFLVFSLKTYYKALFLERLTKGLAILLFISLVFWFLLKIGINLPMTNISYEASGKTYILNNYFFFIEYTFDYIVFQRFMSFFIEPGYLGSLMAILIYINNFDFKRKEILVFLVVLVCTFSIAGYLMFIFSYFSKILVNKKFAILYLILFSLILFSIYDFSIKYNNGNNIFNELVVERLYLNEQGQLSGYNRTTEELDQNFSNFLKSNNLITGVSESKIGNYGEGVGYKPYTIANGLIGLFLLIVSYFSGFFFNRKLSTLTIILLFIMIFIKGHSEIFWAGFLMIYASAIYLPSDWRTKYQFKK